MNGFGTRTAALLATLVLGLALAAGCGEDGVVNPTPPQDPQHIAVRYVLIGFNGSVPGVIIARTKAEAEALALDVYAQARNGADFGVLIATYSDSPSRDTVHAANYGVMLEAGEYQRNTLVKGFGDVAFALVPDSIGLANYDSTANPYGWYVINRIE
jgi:parvulin-like peptidyl-prolyl isomerase